MRTLLATIVITILATLPADAAKPGDQSFQRLKLSPASGTSFKIVAEYDNSGITCDANRRKPLHARYSGALEVVRTPDGTLALVNELTFQRYLEGLAEVPRSWPLEALKAQVIAARSYALFSYLHGGNSSIGYDLCSTDACQVYRGLQVSEGAFGDAWVRAVRETTGRVLLFQGRPIDAFYFSTSWGRTVTNVEGFGGGTPLPYLQPTAGEDDDAPYAHWHVEIPLGDLAPMLRASSLWNRSTITSASVGGSEIVVSDGVVRTRIPLLSFRRSVNAQADCIFPDRYPPKIPGGGHLPQTIPSPHLSAAVRNGRVVIDGRGWGHGVGMSQYGARSLASRGRDASSILAHFYGGLRPQAYREPTALRVLLADDAVRIIVEADGPFAATGPNGRVALGSRFTVRGGRTLAIVRAGSITPILTVNPLTPVATQFTTGTDATVKYVLPTAAKVRPFVSSGGSVVVRGDEVSQISGPNQIGIRLVDTSGAPLAPGSYDVGLEASDGVDDVRAGPVRIHVVAAVATPSPSPPGPRESDPRAILIGIAALLVAGASAVGVVARRRRQPKVNV